MLSPANRASLSVGLSDTHVIRRTNQALSATTDAETIDDAAAAAAAAVHNKTPLSVIVL